MHFLDYKSTGPRAYKLKKAENEGPQKLEDEEINVVQHFLRLQDLQRFKIGISLCNNIALVQISQRWTACKYQAADEKEKLAHLEFTKTYNEQLK